MTMNIAILWVCTLLSGEVSPALLWNILNLYRETASLTEDSNSTPLVFFPCNVKFYVSKFLCR
jgi:hypothetical protein